LRSAIWILLFVLGLTGVLIPTCCFYVASQLPPLQNEFDLQRLLRRSGERHRAGSADLEATLEAQAPDFARLPRDLIALYISQLGCPTFFKTRREDGPRWVWRLASATIGSKQDGEGSCEVRLALRLAAAAGIRGALQQSAAAHKIHGLLQKDQLIAHDLQLTAFEQGVVGVEAAAKLLFNKNLDALELTEMAELVLALPPSDLYRELKACRNPALIRQTRDQMLILAERYSLLAVNSAQSARVEPAFCTRN